MSHIQFNDESPYTVHQASHEKSMLIRLAYKTGIPRSDTEANYLLVGIGVVSLVIMLTVLMGQLGTASSQELLTPEELRTNNGFSGPIPGPSPR